MARQRTTGETVAVYQVRVRGKLSRTLLAEFEELQMMARKEHVETVLTGPVEDAAALHGLLRRIEALGLELVEVRQAVTPDDTDAGTRPRTRAPTRTRPVNPGIRGLTGRVR
jgi:hypothetical protein